MIIGFSRHGTGGGRGPVDYLTSGTRPGRDVERPVVLRGDPENTAALIDALEFRHRYTSGVLSFAPEDGVTPEQEQAIMDRFEQVAFAGLEADRYSILWVRHAHAGHHELHFVTPRVELSTGKSLNIRPPGEVTKRVFDDLRSEINARYGFASPDDPDRARGVAVPDYALKTAAEALRRGERPEHDMRVLIDAVLSQRAVQGLIRDRADLVEQVTELGLTVTREGKDYITVSEPESGQRWRMRGTLYEREYTAGRAIEAAESGREREYGVADAGAADRLAQRVEQHIAARAGYHTERYAAGAERDGCRISAAQERHLAERAETPRVLPGAECGHRPDDYLSERLGVEYLAGEPDSGELGRNSPSENHAVRAGEPHRRAEYREERERGVRGVAEGSDNRKRLDRGETERSAGDEVANDRAGNALVKRIERVAERAKRTAESLRAGAARFTAHVRAYCAGQQDAESAGRDLAGAGHQLDAAAPGVREPLRQEQEIAQRQEAERQRSRKGQYYDLSL